MNNEGFLNKCVLYKKQLSKCDSFETIHELWGSTSIPYDISNNEPLSEEYKNFIRNLYEKMTSNSYTSQNELTSNKQSNDSFSLGYPWTSKNLKIAATELSKSIQALSAIDTIGRNNLSIIEFGCGWGNLAIPLVKCGHKVSIVDIDVAFLKRIDKNS
jgi:2-polyprenyl-3-methyl-5-hydroxy-6-metoxy-1,4-benzoquinol methylase